MVVINIKKCGKQEKICGTPKINKVDLQISDNKHIKRQVVEDIKKCEKQMKNW